ncbi:hypothetical protein ABZV34_29580 [Streptomyces sp. NPDC005195]|uniref:hypothetical protein n=1 Tax=Streptomyces sp. NPDC005195 TaxID=3154561 RepID=UPI0033ACF48A
MAEPQSNAPVRAAAGAPASGVIHVRTRLTAEFTVLANALAQRRGSAVTIGVAAYIASLPDGTPVSITALCAHFSEGEILISRALRELEAAGYLERRRERGPDGQVRTRTFFHDVPRGPGRRTPPPPRPRRSAVSPAPATATPPEPARLAPPPPLRPEDTADRAATDTDADPRSVLVLASLQNADRRLILSRREVAELAPAVARWLALGLGPEDITGLLTAGLPAHFRARPARVLAHRLREVPLPPPAPTPPRAGPTAPAVHPWQTCDGCERAFRAPGPAACRDCRSQPAA